MDLSPIAYAAVLAAVGLLLYAFLWWVTSGLPRAAKIIARAALTLVALLPVVLGVFFGAQMPKQAAQQSTPPSVASEEKSRAEEVLRRRVEVERARRKRPDSLDAREPISCKRRKFRSDRTAQYLRDCARRPLLHRSRSSLRQHQRAAGQLQRAACRGAHRADAA